MVLLGSARALRSSFLMMWFASVMHQLERWGLAAAAAATTTVRVEAEVVLEVRVSGLTAE
jgi:hypothetical protein